MIVQRLSKPISAAGIIGFAITVAAFIIVGVASTLGREGESWFSVESWKRALAVSWLPLMAALYLKLSEKFKRAYTQSRESRRNLLIRKLTAGRALIELHDRLQSGQYAAAEMRHVREGVLRCVVACLSDQFPGTQSSGLTASVVDFSTNSLGRMRVVARSSGERQVDLEYEVDQLVAWNAIKSGRIVVEDDVRDDPRWHNVGRRRYRTVCAVPITRSGFAYGALSIDSEVPFMFYGKAAEIAIRVEPYLAVLALTYSPDATKIECRYDANHV